MIMRGERTAGEAHPGISILWSAKPAGEVWRAHQPVVCVAMSAHKPTPLSRNELNERPGSILTDQPVPISLIARQTILKT